MWLNDDCHYCYRLLLKTPP